MSTFCLQAEKKSSIAQSSGKFKATISVSHNANTKLLCASVISAKNGISLGVKSKASGSLSVYSKTRLSNNTPSKPSVQGKIRTLPKFNLNLVGKNKSVSNFKDIKVDKFAGNIDRIKELVNFASTQKLYPTKDIITNLNNSYFVDKNLQTNNLYSSIDEGVAIGPYVHSGKNSSLISDEKNSYIQPSSIFTKGDFRYKFEVTRPNSIDESFLFIRAAAPVSNYSSDIPPQYRLHNIKLEDPSGNLIVKYKDITIRGDADYNTDYVNFATYISEPEINNLKLNIWDNNYPIMDLPSGYTLNIDFAIDCLDDPFSHGFDKGYEDTCKLEFVNSSNNDYLSLDGSPLSTQVQNFSLNPTNSIRISAIEIVNSGGIGTLEGNHLSFYTEVNSVGQRLIRNILPVEILQYNQDLGIYPAASSVWQSSSDDFGNFGLNTSSSGSQLLISKLQDSSPQNYIKLIYTDPVDDSGRLTLKFAHSPPSFVDTLTEGAFNLAYQGSYDKSSYQSVQEIDSFFTIDEIKLKIFAKKESGSRDYALDIVGFSDDKLLNITPKLGAFLQNENAGVGSIPLTSGFYSIDDLGISSEAISDKSQYFESNITDNPAGDHYKLSTVPLVTGTSFQEYIIPLKITPNQYADSTNFESLYLDIYNLPSGAVISTAQLVISYKPSNGLMLHTLGQESAREFARRTINIYPSHQANGQRLLNSYISDGPLSEISNIPHGFSEDETLKTNYSRRWRSVDGVVVDGPYDVNQFDFSFYNPQLNTPFLNGYFTFNNDNSPFIVSEKITSENQPLSGIFVGNYEKTKNIGLRFDNSSLFGQSTGHKTIDWTRISGYENHELYGKILDSYDNAIRLNGTNKYIKFEDVPTTSGFSVYARFTPDINISGVGYNLFNSGVLFSKWDSGENLEFALGYQNGHLCGYARTSTGNVITVVDPLNYDEYQYPLSVILTYNDNLSQKLKLYTDNEILETFNTLRASSSEFVIGSGSSDICFGYCSGSGVGINAFIHEIGISTYNASGTNILESGTNRLLKQNTAESFLRGHRSVFNNNTSRDLMWSYVDDNTYDWKLGDFKICAFSPDFDGFTKRIGSDFIIHSLQHSGSGYNITSDLGINHSQLSYHSQIENDFLRFNLSDIPESENFYSTYPRICKTLPRSYNFEEESIVVETILEHETKNNIIWEDNKVGPKLIVSLYTKSQDPALIPNAKNWGLINRSIHYLEPSGCFVKLRSYLNYQDLINSSEPWADFDLARNTTEFDHKYFSKDINDMFLQYDLVYPSGGAFDSSIKIHSANIKLENAIRKSAYNSGIINLSTSGELISFSNIDLHCVGASALSSNVELFVSGSAVPSVSGSINLYSFGAYIDYASIPLFATASGVENNSLFIFVASRSDKSDEKLLNLFTQNKLEDQTSINYLAFFAENKPLTGTISGSLDFSILAGSRLISKFPFNTAPLYINGYNERVLSSNDNSMSLYINSVGLFEVSSGSLPLFAMNYTVDPLVGQQEIISWNATNYGKNITTADNNKAFLDANDEIRGVELICYGNCDNSESCSEDVVESHSIIWEAPNECVNGGILRAKNTYTNLETSGFKTEIGYSGHFYGIRKYDGLIPNAPYSIIIEGQTGNNSPIPLPFEFTEVEYGSNEYVNYSGIKLVNEEINIQDEYGKSISIRDNLMAVGAPKHTLTYYEYDNNNLVSGTLEDAGAVFVYRRENRPSGYNWPVDKDKSPWLLETKLTLPSGLLKDYFIPTYTNTIGNISLPLPITERRWQVGQEGREFGHSVAIGINSGIKSFEEDNREIIVVGGPSSKWTPRSFEELQTSGVQVGILVFTDEFTPTVQRRSGRTVSISDYNEIIANIQNKDLIFKYFSDPPVSFDVKIIICEPISDYSNRTPLEFPNPVPSFITKRVIARNQGLINEERNEKIFSGIKEAFHDAFPYDPTKLNNNIPVMLGIYVDNTRSMRNAIDGKIPSLNNFISYYQSYSFASGLIDFYGIQSSGAVVRYNQQDAAHWIDASKSTLDYILDTGRLLQDNQVRFFTSGIGQEAFNSNLSQFNYPPDSGGKVFVFEKESGVWNLIQEIKSPNIIYDHPDRFGHSVSISNNTEVIAIGSPYISESCQIFEFKQSEKDRVFNEIFSWVSHKSSVTGGIGRYANLISNYYSWVAKYGSNYSNRILYSQLTSTEKFEARKYLNIEEYKKVYTYSQGNTIGKAKWNFILDEFAPTARLGYSTAVNEDGSIVAFGAPTDSFNQWDDARVYYKNLGYYNAEDTSLNTNLITPAWRSNVNAGAVRIFESRKYYPHNKVVEFGKFGNLQKELNLPEDSGHFNYLPTIFQDKNFEVTPFSQVNIPEDAGLAFIITPSIDALSNEVLDNIVDWLSLGDRNLVLVGNDPVWENGGVYAESNEIINKILEELDSRMKLFPARNQNESCLTDDVLGIPTYVDNATSTYISRTNVNIHGVADIRTNFDNVPLLKDQIIRSSCSPEQVSLGNEISVTLPTANTRCELPIKNNGDLRAQWYKYCISCGKRLKYAVNLPFYFSSFTPLCNCDEEQTKEELAQIRVNAPGQEPVPILAAAKKQIETIVIPSSEPVYGLRPIYETRIYSQNSIATIFDENSIASSPAFIWSTNNPVNVSYLSGADNIIEPKSQSGIDGILQILGSPFSEQTFAKKLISDNGYFCVEESLYGSKIIAIAGMFTESESILYNSGLDRSISNDENINFYVNMVLKSNEEGSRIKFLSSSWVGRSNFTDAYQDSQLHGVFLDNGNDVEYSDTIYSYDDICWIANPKSLPSEQQINDIKLWLASGNKKLIITRDNSLEQIKIIDELFKLLGSNIESLYLPVDNIYPITKINSNRLLLNIAHPISTGFNQATSIRQISIFGGSYAFIPFKVFGPVVPIAYNEEAIFDTEIITNGFWKIDSIAKVSFPAIAGSGYKVFINAISDNQYESQILTIYTENAALNNPSLPYPESNIGFYEEFSSTKSTSFNLQAFENKSTIDFYIKAKNPRINNVIGYIPKTPQLISISGVVIDIKETIISNSIVATIPVGSEQYLIKNAEPERVITREFFDYIKNDNTQYCSDSCLNVGFDNQLIADGPVIVAQEQEHITSFNAGYKRSRITLISDSSIVQGKYLPDNEGRIPQSTLNFLTSLYPTTDFSSSNLGRQFNQQAKIVAPERGSPQKYLSLIINSGINYKFGGGSNIAQSPAAFNGIESAYDPRYVLDPLDPWDISDDDVSIENKKNIQKNIFRQQEINFGAKSKFTEVIDGTVYKDAGLRGGLPQLLKDKGYDYIDFDRLPSGFPGDLFGYSISLYKDKLVVGAPFAAFSDQDINPWQQYIDGGSSSGIELSYNGGAGAVYIFEKTFQGSGLHGSLTPWEFTKKLRPQSINAGQDIFDGSGYEILGNHNYAAEFLSNYSIITDQFGRSVSIDSDIISVGAPGHDFGNLYINGSGSFIRKCFNEEFNIPSRKVIDLGNSGIRNQYPNSGITVLNNGAIFTFENKIIDWPTKTKDWILIEKIVPNERTQGLNNSMMDGGYYNDFYYTELDAGSPSSNDGIVVDGNGISVTQENINVINGTENLMFGTNCSIDRSFRSDADYSIAGGTSTSGHVFSSDIMLRQPAPSVPSPSAYIQARAFGERYIMHPSGEPHVYISIVNNGENAGKYYASGVIYSDENGQIFVEASGQDPITRGFIAHRPFISSIDGKYLYGISPSGSLSLFTKSAGILDNSMNFSTIVDDTAIVYNNLGLYASAVTDIVNNLPSGLILYINPDPVSISNSGLTLFASGIGTLTDTLNMRIRGRA